MNDDVARNLLPALAAGTLAGEQLGELFAYLEGAPHLRREADRLVQLLDRAVSPPEAVVPSVWAAIAAELPQTAPLPVSAPSSPPGEWPHPFVPQTEEAESPLGGTQFGGYVIGRRLGWFGMGEEYLGFHEAESKRARIRVLSPEASTNPRTVRRFFREARAAAKFVHPNLEQIEDIGTSAEGLHYLAMPYQEHSSVEDLLRSTGALDLNEALRITLDAARALQAVHQQGALHRDLTAESVCLTKQGRVLVRDLGMAKDLFAPEPLLADGGFLATPLYMAPEIGRVTDVDGRADLYSLGVVFYYLLTGVQPFRGFNALEILKSDAHAKLAPPETHRSDLPPDYRRVLGAMLCKDRKLRYATAAEVIRDLEALGKGSPVPRRASLWP